MSQFDIVCLVDLLKRVGAGIPPEPRAPEAIAKEVFDFREGLKAEIRARLWHIESHYPHVAQLLEEGNPLKVGTAIFANPILQHELSALEAITQRKMS